MLEKKTLVRLSTPRALPFCTRKRRTLPPLLLPDAWKSRTCGALTTARDWSSSPPSAPVARRARTSSSVHSLTRSHLVSLPSHSIHSSLQSAVQSRVTAHNRILDWVRTTHPVAIFRRENVANLKNDEERRCFIVAVAKFFGCQNLHDLKSSSKTSGFIQKWNHLLKRTSTTFEDDGTVRVILDSKRVVDLLMLAKKIFDDDFDLRVEVIGILRSDLYSLIVSSVSVWGLVALEVFLTHSIREIRQIAGRLVCVPESVPTSHFLIGVARRLLEDCDERNRLRSLVFEHYEFAIPSAERVDFRPTLFDGCVSSKEDLRKRGRDALDKSMRHVDKIWYCLDDAKRARIWDHLTRTASSTPLDMSMRVYAECARAADAMNPDVEAPESPTSRAGFRSWAQATCVDLVASVVPHDAIQHDIMAWHDAEREFGFTRA